MKLTSLIAIMILTPIIILTSGCKEDSDSFDLLVGGDNTNTVEDLEIVSRLPDQAEVILKIGESEGFSISAMAPNPSLISYSWSLDGTPQGAGQTFTFLATLELVGDHTLVASATDGTTTKQISWTIRVNGPPVITPVSTTTQKVSVGSSLNILANATDPNGDSLTYTWTLDGATSPYIIGSDGTGALTGHDSIVGARTITLTVSDGTESTSYSWNAEINHFPMACNTLTQGQICTYSGGPNKGSGFAVDNSSYPLRFRPFAHVQDALGNLFISDLDSHVIWYWNKTAAPVTRLGQTIPAGIIQIVAGTGEQTSGGTGIPALSSGLNNPRGLWYNDATGTLYVAEYSGSRVKYIDSSGTVFIGMGGGTSFADGDTAFNHDCNNPVHLSHYNNNIYVSCYGHHRVKRWDLATDLGYTVAGDGGADNNGEDADPLTSGIRRPYGLYVDSNGIYITSFDRHVVRFVNHSGAPYVFWNGNPDQVTIADGNIATIIGDGGTGETGTNQNPLSESIRQPQAITVRNTNEIYLFAGSNRDDLVLANNSIAGVTIDGLTTNAGEISRINSPTAGYNGDNILTNTRFNDIYQITVDNQDNDKLIISDYSNYRLREVDLANGVVNHLAGSGRGELGFYGDVELPTQEHLFNYPTGLVFDNSSRTLFFADQNNHRLRQTDAFGRTSSALCRGSGDPTIDNDFPSNALCRTNINGNNSLNNGFDIMADGSLAVLNSYGHNIRIWNRTSSNQIYFNQFIQEGRVSTVAGDWSLGAGNGADGLATSAQYNYPNSAKFYNNAGNYEFVDTMNHCVRMVDSAGISTTMLGLCGTSGNPGNNVAEAAARFNRPRGLVIDPSNGNVFISDFNNHTIWYWNRTAAPVTIGSITINPNFVAKIACLTGTAGSSTENIFATTSRCNQPVGLALNGNNLCYAQRNRHNVRCIDLTSGLVNTVAGNPEAAPRSGSVFDFSQEGISATSATLSYPSNITFDSNGDLYISDTYNHLIRKVKLSAD